MNKKYTSFISILLVACLTLAIVASLIASIGTLAAPTQQDINEAQKKVEEAERKKKDAESKKKSVLAEKSELELEIGVIQSKLDDISADLEEKNKELAEAENKAERQYEAMKLRLRTMYEDNSSSYIQLILSGESLSDAIFNYELIKQLITYDSNMYDELCKTRARIEVVKNEIEANKKSIEDEKSILDEKNRALQKTVDSLNQDINESQKEKEQAEQEMQRLRQQYAASLRSSAPAAGGAMYTGGQLQWPTPSSYYITSEYGYRLHPTLNVWKGHTGVDIGAGYGANVLAAEDGTVTVAGYNVAYGYYIIINHGGGLSTLYAHNSSLLVTSGQNVSRGQTIAKVGSTGYSTGPHCHFEVMVNGVTTDPMPYLR